MSTYRFSDLIICPLQFCTLNIFVLPNVRTHSIHPHGFCLFCSYTWCRWMLVCCAYKYMHVQRWLGQKQNRPNSGEWTECVWTLGNTKIFREQIMREREKPISGHISLLFSSWFYSVFILKHFHSVLMLIFRVLFM